MSRPSLTADTKVAEEVTVEDCEVRQVPLVTIGGGLGSFALVDRLRIGGVRADRICVVSPHLKPDQAFASACRASGMTSEDRLRSDSSARIDNLWGFPSYAVAEAHRRARPWPLVRALLEPVFAQPYTPPVGLMQELVAREANRIDWPAMVTRGLAHRIIKQPDGRYLVLVRRRGRRDLALHCRYVHLAVGTAGPRLTPEAGAFREKHPEAHLVHAYEPHESIYRALAEQGGSVLVRGSGIASSQILQRLIDVRDRSGQDIHLWQLFRNYHAEPTGPLTSRRDAGHGFRYQSFEFPKAAVGGQLRDVVRRVPEEERILLVREFGASSTPYRTEWASQLRRGREEGWYDAIAGRVISFETAGSQIAARLRLADGKSMRLPVDFVIDATGMEMAGDQHPIVADLVRSGGATLNDLDGLRVDENFVVDGADSGDGLVFASGMTSRGAPLAPVDSFLGLQSAAHSIAEVLAAHGMGKRLTPLRSVSQWWKWMGGESV